MFRRRRRGAADEVGTGDGTVDDGTVDDGRRSAADDEAGATDAGGKPSRPDGPWDASELDLDDPAERAGRIDLGAIRIKGSGQMQLQVQMDEATQQITGVLVVIGDAAVQLLAVAAPRSEAQWPDVRGQVVADAVRRGGSAQEAEGPFGTELRVLVPVKRPDGTDGVQPSRMVGIDGPRWLLRANFLGRAAVEEQAFANLAQVVRDVVVVRGEAPMPPGELIAFRLPDQAAAPAQPEVPARPALEDLDPGPTATEVR